MADAPSDYFAKNAYGLIMDENNGERVPVICGHGGSGWLCHACAVSMLKSQRSDAD